MNFHKYLGRYLQALLIAQGKRQRFRQGGFTLMELIAVLVLLGIMLVFGGLGLARGVQGYMWAHDNVVMTQQGQAAASRLVRELFECFDCVGDNTSFINPNSPNRYIFDNVYGPRRIEYSEADSELRIGNSDGSAMNLLMENVTRFEIVLQGLQGSQKVPIVNIEMDVLHESSGNVIPFQSSFLPRNRFGGDN